MYFFYNILFLMKFLYFYLSFMSLFQSSVIFSLNFSIISLVKNSLSQFWPSKFNNLFVLTLEFTSMFTLWYITLQGKSMMGFQLFILVLVDLSSMIMDIFIFFVYNKLKSL